MKAKDRAADNATEAVDGIIITEVAAEDKEEAAADKAINMVPVKQIPNII